MVTGSESKRIHQRDMLRRKHPNWKPYKFNGSEKDLFRLKDKIMRELEEPNEIKEGDEDGTV